MVKNLFPKLKIEVIVPYYFAQSKRDVSGVRPIASDKGRFLVKNATFWGAITVCLTIKDDVFNPKSFLSRIHFYINDRLLKPSQHLVKTCALPFQCFYCHISLD